MRQQYTLDIAFLVLVIAVSLVGFSSLLRGDGASLTGYHVLHIVTSLAWLILLLGQLVLVQQRRYDRHRFVGASILAVGPILIASLTLLTVHSAGREAAAGTVDDLVVQNVMFTLQVALLVFLAFALRRNRKVHGALLMSTALMFLVIAFFFTLISYVPGYRIEGPETFDRFAKSGQTSALIGRRHRGELLPPQLALGVAVAPCGGLLLRERIPPVCRRREWSHPSVDQHGRRGR
jgi:uncharacterized membrane protein YozB (DUF420 family)